VGEGVMLKNLKFRFHSDISRATCKGEQHNSSHTL
jgi:hypothetical protein